MKDKLRKSCRAYDPPVSALAEHTMAEHFIFDSMEIICDDAGLTAEEDGHTPKCAVGMR